MLFIETKGVSPKEYTYLQFLSIKFLFFMELAILVRIRMKQFQVLNSLVQMKIIVYADFDIYQIVMCLFTSTQNKQLNSVFIENKFVESLFVTVLCISYFQIQLKQNRLCSHFSKDTTNIKLVCFRLTTINKVINFGK